MSKKILLKEGEGEKKDKKGAVQIFCTLVFDIISCPFLIWLKKSSMEHSKKVLKKVSMLFRTGARSTLVEIK